MAGGMPSQFRVLYVDDEPGMLEVCKEFLELSGEVVLDTACSAREARDRIARLHYDAVVSDYQMPEMSGIELLKWVRASGNRMPFILFTGRGREEVVIEALNSGATSYVQKGGDAISQFAELEDRIKRAIREHRAEQALRESEERFHHIFDHANDAIVISDLEGRILDVNEQTCRVSGFGREELIGRILESEVGAKTAVPMSTLIKEVVEKGCARFETLYRTKGGQSIATEVVASLISYNGRGAILSVVRDITERKRAEDAVRKSEARFRTIFDKAEVGIAAVSLDGRPIDFNDKLVEMLGYSREELGSMVFTEYTHPDDVERDWHLFEHLLSGRIKSYEIEKRYVCKSGEVLWARLFVNMVQLGEGEPETVLAIVNDITERKRAEEEMLASKLQLTMAMDLANLVDWEHDVVRGEFHFSDRFYSLYGTTAEREGGHRMPADTYFREFVHPDDLDAVLEFTDRVTSPEFPDDFAQLEHRIVRRDGEVRHIIVRLAVTRGDNGDIVRTRGVNQDITELKMAEERLRKVDEKLSLLMSTTRHDMSNQLAVLGGNIALLRQTSKQDPKALALVERMERSVEKLNSMLAFSRDYQHLGIDSPRWQRIGDLFYDPLQYMELEGLGMTEEARSLEVLADPMLGKVFHNIVENSIRHGGRPVSVSISCQQRSGDMFLVIEDDGTGVPAEDKELIFKKGFGKGTGLGLFLSQQVLGITGITIRETGAPGRGARFEMLVPGGKWRFA